LGKAKRQGFAGCFWMIFGGELVILFCLNQDFQDLRIFRMLLDDFWWGVGDFICQNQDFQDLRIYGLYATLRYQDVHLLLF
jgi:hypothetical protein